MIANVVAGAFLGAAFGYAGGMLAPRWMEKGLRPWEPYSLAAVNGLLVGLLAAQAPLDNYFWQQFVFISILTTAALVDLHDRIIPNDLVLAGIAIGLPMLFLLPYPDKLWWEGLAGMAAGFLFLLVLALLVRGGMGLGDVKLAAVIGLFLGWKLVGMGLMLAFLAGGFVGATLMLLKIVGRKDHIPFGPWLALGAAITAIYGSEIWVWYTAMY